MVNGLPLEYDLIVMEAALAVNASYMDLVLKLCPPAPKYPDEIKAIIDEGVVVPEQFDADARRYCFEELAKLDITVDEFIGN